MLDAELGGNVLIRHIRVYANSAEMPLLDEIQDCNILAGVRYDYNVDDSMRKKRDVVRSLADLTTSVQYLDRKVKGQRPAQQSPRRPMIRSSHSFPLCFRSNNNMFNAY